MANENEIISIDTANAQRAVTQLQTRIAQLEKEAKGLAATDKRLKSVESELFATRQRLSKATTDLANAQKRATAANGQGAANVNLLSGGYAKLFGRVKNAGGALAAVGGSLTNVLGLTTLATPALALLSKGFEMAYEAAIAYLFPTDKALEITKSLAGEFLKEKAALDTLFPVLLSNTASMTEKQAALLELEKAYGQYLPKIDLEKASLQELNAVYQLVNNAILENIVAKAKQEEKSKLIAELIASETEAVRKRNEAERANQANIISQNKDLLQLIPLFGQTIVAGDDAIKSVYKLRSTLAQGAVNDTRNQLGELDQVFDQVANNLRDVGLDTAVSSTQNELDRLTAALQLAQLTSKRTGVDLGNTIDNLTQRIAALNVVRKGELEAAKASVKTDREKRANDAKAARDAFVLSNSLRDLETQLQALTKEMQQYTDVTDAAKLGEIGQQMAVLNERIANARKLQDELSRAAKSPYEQALEAAKKLAATDETTYQRQLADIESRRQMVLQSATDELAYAKANAAFDKERANLEKDNALQTIERRMLVLSAEKALAQQRGESVDALDKEMATLYRERVELLKTAKVFDDVLSTRLATQEKNNQAAINAINSQRNAELRAATDKATQDKINARFDENVRNAELIGTRNILNTRLEILNVARATAVALGNSTTAIDTEIEKVKGELIGVDTQLATLGDAAIKGGKWKDWFNEIANGAEQVVSSIIGIFETINQQQTQQLDEAIARQQTALQNLLDNTETTNVQQVQLEKDRLAALQKEREQAANKELLLANIKIASELAVGIARAVAEGGGIGSIATVAAALGAAALGFAQARAQARNAYYHGTTFVDDKNAPQGRDTIPAWLNRGEAVITTDTNKKYSKTVQAIHNQTVPAPIFAAMVEAYHNGKPFAINQTAYQATPTATNETNALLRSINQHISRPQPATQSQTHLTEKGLSKFVRNTIAQTTKKAQRFKR